MFTSTLFNKNIFVYALVYLAFIILTPHFGNPYDTYCWGSWIVYMFGHNLENIYHSGSDYPPLYYYILNMYGSLKGSESAILDNLYQLKYITFFFEFCSVLLLFRFIKEEFRVYFFIFIILNPGFFYNSVIWGQVDGIVAFLLLSSVVLFINRKNTFGLLVYLLCLNFKIQSIIYLPLVCFLLLNNLSDYKGILHSSYVLLSLVALELLIISPFINSNTTDLLSNAIFNSVDRYPKISMNAYNWWYWIFEEDPMEVLDTGTWLGRTYKSWGMLLFFVASFFAMLPLFIMTLSNAIHKTKTKIEHIDVLFLTTALITLVFFFCNTQMHERYSHYALIFLAGYFAVTKNYIPFLLMSFAYFLNMEDVMQGLHFPHYGILLFNPEFIAAIFLALIGYLYFLIYKNHFSLPYTKDTIVRLFKK